VGVSKVAQPLNFTVPANQSLPQGVSRPANFTSPLIAERQDYASQSKNSVGVTDPQPLPNHIKRQIAGPRSPFRAAKSGNL
jgi:hypothetical protein